MVVLEIRVFYEEIEFRHYLQHYSGTKKTNKQKQKHLQRFYCTCGFISKSAILKYHQLLSILFQPVNNSFLLKPSLTLISPSYKKVFKGIIGLAINMINRAHFDSITTKTAYRWLMMRKM